MSNNYCHENRIGRPTNCKNCGAPLHGSKCEYCGTEYSFCAQQIANIKFGTPLGYIKNADGSYSDICEGVENRSCIM